MLNKMLPLYSKIKNVILIGSRPLASQCLQYLLDTRRYSGIQIVAVVGIAKNTFGWWSHDGFNELWQIAEANNLKYIAEDELQNTEFDMLICINWSTIFKEGVLKKAKYGCINLHTAPLPSYRGCHCYSHAILNQEKFYGTTLHFMDHGIDTGDIIECISFPILKLDTAYSLYLRTSEYSYAMFCNVFWRILDGSLFRISQIKYAKINGKEAKYYNNNSILAYSEKNYVINKFGSLNKSVISLLNRALYFPHKLNKPEWLLKLNIDK